MNKITVTAPAKINLFLEVHNMNNEGFHNIESVMQTVSLCDTLDIERKESGIILTGAEEKLSCGPNNLIIKAAEAFLPKQGKQAERLFTLQKRYPLPPGWAGAARTQPQH